jgi:hypothetical protein
MPLQDEREGNEFISTLGWLDIKNSSTGSIEHNSINGKRYGY